MTPTAEEMKEAQELCLELDRYERIDCGVTYYSRIPVYRNLEPTGKVLTFAAGFVVLLCIVVMGVIL